ncbi:RUS family member 1-like [Lytechinus variegatus]|uniref:RUS family member 1-like n=1 Tax=Lytechinus variegatus TaxID=7654 RepID=UPI001BB10A2E|nr:RUS family member 1-like [Lytechinus variegatus]
MDTLICRETYGSRSDPRDYMCNNDGKILESRSSNRGLSSLLHFFRVVFLPQGYPDSVSKDYLEYQIWDTVQAFSSSITGTLSTHAMLKGVGVGDETASAAAATITWLLRDGTSMTGRIAFAWYQGSSLDSDAKRWRLFADIMNDAALCIELISVFFPQYFVIIACMSSLFKSMVGVAGGATRAALTMHQARRNNMADVSAKDGSQETLVNLAALFIGLIITPMASKNILLTWTLFFLCTCLHLYANYRAVTCVVMETLNQTRFHILVQDYLHSSHVSMCGPDAVNRKEPVIWRLTRPLKLNLGIPFNRVAKSMRDLEMCLKSNGEERFLLSLDMKKGCIDIVIHHDSTSEDVLKACLQAEIIMYTTFHLHANRVSGDSLSRELTDILERGVYMSRDNAWQAVKVSGQICNKLFPRFLHDLGQAGWVKGHSQMGADEWRATWNMNGIDARKVF